MDSPAPASRRLDKCGLMEIRGDVHAHGLVYGRPVPGGRGRRLAEKTGGAVKTHESEHRRVTLAAQAMQTPGEPRCDANTLARRLEEWEGRRRTPVGGTPAFERIALEEMLARARAAREEAEP